MGGRDKAALGLSTLAKFAILSSPCLKGFLLKPFVVLTEKKFTFKFLCFIVKIYEVFRPKVMSIMKSNSVSDSTIITDGRARY